MAMKALIVDFSRVLVFPIADDIKSLNRHHEEMSVQPGYQFFDYFSLNVDLLHYFDQVKAYIPVYIFTDGKLHDLPEVSHHLGTIFRNIYSAEELNLDKKRSDSYTTIAKHITLPPEDIVFVDDKTANIKAARTAGLTAILYISNDNIIEQLDELLHR